MTSKNTKVKPLSKIKQSEKKALVKLKAWLNEDITIKRIWLVVLVIVAVILAI